LTKFSIAIPDSTLIDEQTQLEKTRKISKIARACAIFQVDTIYIYREKEGTKSDFSLLSLVLKYLETPQYMRKRVYSKIQSLKYAGVLEPLKIPSHIVSNDIKKVIAGDVRDGLVIQIKGKKFVDVGLKQPLRYFGKELPENRVTIQFKEGYPVLTIKEIPKDQLKQYWGYKIKNREDLYGFISSWEGKVILTSKKGKKISYGEIKSIIDSQENILLVFGSPNRGLHEILNLKIRNLQNSKIFNFFPNQATETIRLEEAILGTLSSMNLFRTS